MKVLNVMLAKNQILAGSERASLDYNNMLLQCGFDVTFMANPTSLAYRTAKLMENETFKVQPCRVLIEDISFWAALKARRFIYDFQPDIILTHAGEAAKLIQRALGATPKIPVVNVMHLPKRYRGVKPFAYFVLCNTLKQDLISSGHPEERIFQLPNTIFTTPKESFSSPQNNIPTFGKLARLDANKNFEMLIEGIAILRDRGITARLLIAGKGHKDKQEHLLKQLAASLDVTNQIEFLGWLESDKQKQHFFNSIDAFCITSKSEMFPLIALEAMANRAPLISVPVGALSEVLVHQKNSLCVQHNNAKDLADKMQYLISNPQTAKTIANEGFKTYQKYQPSEVAKDLKHNLETVLALAC